MTLPVCLMKYLKMRFYDSALSGNASHLMMMMILLLLIATLVTTVLSEEVEEKVNVNVCLFTVNIFQTNFFFFFSTTVLGQRTARWKTRHFCCWFCQL